MKKRVIAIICFALSFSLVVPAFAEETDYSYLEDMSIKELKELRAAIDKLLPPEDGNSQGKESNSNNMEFPAEDDNGFALNIDEPHYKMAIDACNAVVETLSNPDSFDLREIYHAVWIVKSSKKEIDKIVMCFTAENKMGGTVKQYSLVSFENGNVDSVSNQGEDDGLFKTHLALEQCEELNVDFVKANLG